MCGANRKNHSFSSSAECCYSHLARLALIASKCLSLIKPQIERKQIFHFCMNVNVLIRLWNLIFFLVRSRNVKNYNLIIHLRRR